MPTPSSPSNAFLIRKGVLAICQGTGQQIAQGQSALASASMKMRMVVKATKRDPLPLLLIVPYGTIGDKPADFETGRDRQYRLRLALIDDPEGDSETKDALYSEWLEIFLNAIVRNTDGTARNQLDGVPGVWEINAESVTTFDDSLLANNLYAMQNLVLRFESQEN